MTTDIGLSAEPYVMDYVMDYQLRPSHERRRWPSALYAEVSYFYIL